MMPLDRMPSISLGIIVPAGAVYDRHHHWRTETGEPRASVGFEAGGHSHAHLQGSPAACGNWPRLCWMPPTEPTAPSTLLLLCRRGWWGDVGRQPRLPSLRFRLAYPLSLARAGR